ncbi:class I adenylate-forming enzyme family protein [Gordonia sp. OPL2]|uniref:class I adenylate-forming enzyme family protein n=1 Tax=Gordonia sp. OPL2 TaxID=2486274 RepID=UPI0016566D67|nr:class I adenylate-forming enzyme family protein [Gordonia sp. OPL2]ROZ99351.1 long-chain fatty acid--CoA ligase [Gordonia sp. OPL2]
MTTAVSNRRTLSSAVGHWAEVRSDGIAVECAGDAVTWSELDQTMTRLAADLHDRGVGVGDRVVLLGENSLHWVVAFLACQRARAVVVPMNTRLAQSQIEQQVRAVEATVVLFDARSEIPSLDGVDCVELAAVVDALRVGPQSNGVADDKDHLDDAPALISFTSGTTGTPKGATVSRSALSVYAHEFAGYFGTGPDDSTLVIVPIFHNTGFADQLAHMVAAGATTRLLRRYRTDDAAAELIARPASFLAAVPSMLRMLMLHSDADAIFAGVQTIMYGGSAIPEAWVHELHRRWPHLALAHAYGLTEFTSVCTVLPSELASTAAESAGKPLPGVQVRVVDDGRDVERGESGEVWLSGPTRMLGYWNAPELTATKLVGPWLRTGDVGRMDADGLLWLHGRVDDVINRGGEKIMPTVVESHIARHDTVAAACVFGYPDEILRERIAAAVELRDGAMLDVDDLRSFLRTTLPDYAIPDTWVTCDRLPVNASGKFDRRALRADLGRDQTSR